MRMMRFVVMGCLAIFIVGHADCVSLAHEDDQTTIIILSPKDGEIVGQTFELKYELAGGATATHAHVFLDDTYQKGFAGVFRGVSKGAHRITVTAATHDHKELPVLSSITVEVR